MHSSWRALRQSDRYQEVQRKVLRWTSRLDINGFLYGITLYGILAFAMAIVYVLVIFATSPPYGAPRSDISPLWWQNLAAIVLIVATVAPLYRPLRRGVSQVIYAQHDDPYTIIAQLNRHLESNQSPQAILAATVETVAAALKLAYVGIEAQDGSQSLATEYGERPDNDVEIISLPLTYLGSLVGELRVAPHAKGAASHSVDFRLLNELARQLGVALYAIQATAELQSSRESIVTAREEERRRIRRDLHDGLGPVLSALQLQLGALRTLVRQDPARAEALAAELRADLRAATGEIRRLVYDLRPPMLDEFGLAGAIRTLSASAPNVALTVQTPQPMPVLSAAQEVALYRIAAEAVHNVIKHARADHCAVTIELAGGHLILSISDNGAGFPPDHAEGVGFASMRERAGELGGSVSVSSPPGRGTRVTARIPYTRKTPEEATAHE